MKKKRVIALCFLLILALTSNVYAGSMTTKVYTINSKHDYADVTLSDLGQGELEQLLPEFKSEDDGRKYKAVRVTAKLISEQKPVKVKKSYTNLTEKKVKKSVTKSGEKLTLDDVAWTEHRRNAATGTATYSGTNTKPDAPATKDITATLPDGSTITVTGQLQRVEKTGSSYSKPFTVTAKFTGDEDVAYYMLGNTKIPNNPQSPVFDGYEKVLLKQLGYDPSRYKITDGKWTSDYKKENGQTVRYAEFSGLQQTADWTAYYTETVTATSPQLATYDAEATYTNGVKDTEYKVMLTVDYERVGLSLLQIVLIAGAAVIVVAGLIAVILLIIRKKRDKEAEKSAA
ncbi:hypothetical protein [Emergencia sp. 1XD21-10]|uniref:hypothetical protein n=1 Tax=Emergencia sp. 1XD21-10 TaxID=2304569 RepID=UPI0013795FCE|nr:hypothetical protein [Emergencia sp. 1XD21-10]NCE98188.1 hypothetical protein [Emergencia sp. 1XD21-10]